MTATPLVTSRARLGFGPTSALSKYVLGVRPVKPGFRTWLIEPQPGDLTWAEGKVPTPYGPIAVRWLKTPRGLRLEINVPNGTSGTVGLPTSSNADSVSDNGQHVQKGEKMTVASESDDSSGARPGYTYLSDLGPGAHVIQVMVGEKIVGFPSQYRFNLSTEEMPEGLRHGHLHVALTIRRATKQLTGHRKGALPAAVEEFVRGDESEQRG